MRKTHKSIPIVNPEPKIARVISQPVWLQKWVVRILLMLARAKTRRFPVLLDQQNDLVILQMRTSPCLL